ncbi:MAG: kelch repeat-containing protein [Candidatus Poribacteria bacterium]|nr:kelch repeat-containing protein [Candidatus Poribacteria bacterium]
MPTVAQGFREGSDTQNAVGERDVKFLENFHKRGSGVIYAIGGGNFDKSLSTVVAYDPATDTWTDRANMPTPRERLSASVVDGRLTLPEPSTGAVKAKRPPRREYTIP